MSEPQLTTLREEEPETDEKFLTNRKHKVLGTFKYVHNDYAKQHKTVKEESAQDSEFVEGTYHELWTFVHQRRLGFQKEGEGDNEEAVIKFIENKYPDYTVEKDKDGVWQVSIPDLPKGTKRWRKEVCDKVGRTKSQEQENEQVAEEVFGHKANKLLPCGLVLGSQDGSEHQPASVQLDESTSDSQRTLTLVQASPPGQDMSTHSNINEAREQWIDSSRKRKASAEPMTIPLGKSSGSSLAGSDDGSTVTVGVCEVGGPKKKRRSSAEASLEGAQVKLDKMEMEYVWSSHFLKRSRGKELVDKVKSLHTAARKCASFQKNAECQTMADNIYSRVEHFEERQAFFDQMRDDFAGFSSRELTPADKKAIDDGPGSLVLQMISYEAERLIPFVFADVEKVDVFMSLASGMFDASCPKLSYGMMLAKGLNIEQHQKSLVVSFVEKVAKQADLEIILKIGNKVSPMLPNTDIANLNPMDSTLVDGWTQQALVDLSCLVLGARALQSERDASLATMAFRSQCCRMVEHEKKISVRLRANFRLIQGAHHNFFKSMWDIMTSFKEFFDRVGKTDVASEKLARIVQPLYDALAKCVAEGNYEDAYNAVVDIIGESLTKTLLNCFAVECAAVDGNMPGDEHDTACQKLASNLITRLFQAVDLVLKNDAFIEEVVNSSMRDGELLPTEPTIIEIEPTQDRGEITDCRERQCIQSMRWLQSVLRMVKDVKTHADDLVHEFSTRVDIHLQALELAAEKDFSNPVKIKTVMPQWSDLWLRSQSIKQCESKLKHGACGYNMQEKTAVLASSKCLGDNIVGLCINLVAGDKSGLTATRVIESLLSAMPSAASPIVSAGYAVEKLKELKNKMASGKPLGHIIELTSTLDEVHKCWYATPSVFERRQGAIECIVELRKEWDLQVEGQISKYTVCKKVVSEFVERFGAIREAVKTWDFGDCSWIVSDSELKENEKALFKKVEAAITQFPTTKNILDRIARQISWLEKSNPLALKLQSIPGQLASFEAEVTSASVIQASNVLCSRIVQTGGKTKEGWLDPKLDVCRRYVKNVLKLDESQLPKEIQDRLTCVGDDDSTQAPSDVGQSVDSPSSSSCSSAASSGAAPKAVVALAAKLSKRPPKKVP